MQQTVLKTLFFVLVALSLTGIWLSHDGTRGKVIKVAFLGSKDDEDYEGALAFKRVVEAQMAGTVRVEIYPAGQFCGNARECLEGLKAGTLEVTMTTAGGVGSLYGPVQILDLPYAFRDDRSAECILDGPLFHTLRGAFIDEDTGLYLGTISNTGGWRSIATVEKQVRRAGDLAGVKLRTVTAPIQQELVRNLGASATPIAWSELYSALATQVVDGTKNSVQDIVGMQFHEHIKHLTLDNHAYMAALWWYSAPLWATADAELKQAIKAGFQELQTVTRASVKAKESEAFRAFEAAGGTVYRPTMTERQTFLNAAAPMRDWFSARYGNEWLAALDNASAACS